MARNDQLYKKVQVAHNEGKMRGVHLRWFGYVLRRSLEAQV